MRGVWNLHLVPSLMVLGALLFLVGRGDVAEAAPFVPSAEWQLVPPGTVLPPGLEIRADLDAGKTWARWPAQEGAVR